MYILFDIGGTNMRVSASEDGQNIGEVITCKTLPNDIDGSIKLIADAAREVSNGQPIKAAAGGVPGVLNNNGTSLLASPNLPDWINKPLQDYLQNTFKAPVFLENDTAIIGLGEAIAGAGQGHEIVAYVTVSTGIGGCRVVKGHIDQRRLGFEPGHQIITVPDWQPGQPLPEFKDVEELASGGGVARQYGTLAENITDPMVWEKSAYYIGAALSNLLMFWSPDIIIIGGSVMKSIQIPQIEAHMKRFAGRIFQTFPPIVPLKLENKAGHAGALALIHSRTR